MKYFFPALIFFGTFCFAEPLSGPVTFLARAIPTEAGREDIGFDVLPLSEGALVSGSTAIGGGSPDGLLMRINNEGDVIWRKNLGEGGMDLLFSAHADGANGLVCVGFKSPDGPVAMKTMDGWILRIDSQGNVTWEYTYGGPGEDRLTAIRKTSNGWVAVGHKEVDGKIHAWVLRIDANGKETGSWTDEDTTPSKGLDIQPLADGGYILVGYNGAQREESDGFVTRLDPNGQKMWTHPISGSGYQVGYHLQAFGDDSFLVIGYGSINNSRHHDAYVFRITSAGKISYRQTMGGPTNDRATNARILENNSIVIVGQTQRPGAKDDDSGWDLIIYGLNRQGTLLWSQRYGGDGVEFGRAVAGKASNLWIIGHTTTGRTGSSVFLIRIDASNLL